MTDRDDELTLIEKRLFKLPPAKFREIVAVIEDRRSDLGGRSPVDALMSRMRPRLVRMRLARRLTLQRLFCRPFEELLTDDPAPRGIGTRISRHSIEPCWRLFVDRADARRLQRLSANLRAADDDGRRMERLGRQLWAYAAEVLRANLRALGGLDATLREVSEQAYRDILFITDYLEVADVMQQLKRRLGPRPLRRASDDHIDAIVTALEAVNAVNREHQHIVIDLLLAWLKRPSDIVAIVDRIAALAKAQIDDDSLALAGEALVEDVEDQLRTVMGLAASSERSDVVRRLRGCVADLIGAHGAFQNRASPTAMRRLDRIRGRVAKLVEDHVLSDCERRVLSAVPQPAPAINAGDATLSNVLPIVALDSPPDPERVQAAEDQAIALRLCAKYAGELGLSTEFFDTVEVLGRAIEDRARWAAARIELGSLTDARRESAEAHFYVAIRILELVAGSDRADNLRRHLIRRPLPPPSPINSAA
jgi:hypothetical protein